MSISTRIIASVRKRGLIGTAVVGVRKLGVYPSTFRDRFFDRRFGTDTHGVVELDDLEIHSDNKGRGVRYEPTRAGPFRKLMQGLDLPRDGVFVDFGCGKGRVLLLAAECGFERVVGVEFSAELCEVARRNVSRYVPNAGSTSTIRVVESDAVDYPIKDDETVFFFFNPFDAVVVERVINGIAASLARNPRRVWFIYHNPVWRHVLDKQPMLERLGAYCFGGCEFNVYGNRS